MNRTLLRVAPLLGMLVFAIGATGCHQDDASTSSTPSASTNTPATNTPSTNAPSASDSSTGAPPATPPNGATTGDSSPTPTPTPTPPS